MKKILYVNYGGLGDHLQFSTLPEAFHKKGFETYISDRSVFRNNHIYDLVWKSNPYIKGFSNESPNCGHCHSFLFPDKNSTINANWELIYNVGMGSSYPKIYSDFNKKDDFENSLLIDINAHSNNDYNFDSIKNYIENVIENGKYENVYYLIPTDDNYSKSILLNIEKSTKIVTKDIFDYSDMINSCKHFICLWSGSSVLSSVIKNQSNKNLTIDCFKPLTTSPNWGITDKSFYYYENINYIN